MNKQLLETYFIMGSQDVVGDPLSVLEAALQNGITLFQWREKGERCLTGDAYLQFAKDCQTLCKRYDVPFIINDDVELAILLDVDGIHVGQDDVDAKKVREQLPHKILGVSVHTQDELQQAIQDGADYVGIGPIFSTQSKKDAKKPVGTIFLTEAAKTTPTLPIVAIGGIQPEHVYDLRQAGADGVSIISAISKAKSPGEATQAFRKENERFLQQL